jgi:RNA polymerase sigma factor (sigma-70 family)
MAELRDWVLQARQGDLESYGKIVRRFQDMAYGYAYSLLSDFHLAEDAAQEAFIEAFRDLADLRTPEAFPGWFRKIVFKQCDRITRRKRPQGLSPQAEGRLPSREPEPGDIAAKKEMAESVLRAIQTLPEPERTVTTLFYINGYSQNDIADFLEVPATTVNNRLHSSRTRLKERVMNMVEHTLKERGPDERFSRKIIEAYFEQIVLPTLAREFPKLLPDMILMSGGSTGLGCDDEFSDMEAGLFLKDELWKSHGWKVQIAMNRCCRHENNPWHMHGAAIYVSPMSGLLDGHAHAFVEDETPAPWEAVSLHDLYNIQEQSALHDPHSFIASLKKATSPEKVPEVLWRKWLIKSLNNLVYNDLGELDKAVKRCHLIEAHVVSASAIEHLFHIGFLINKTYYPWRTHLRWGFEKLARVAPDVLPDLDAAVSAADWTDKLTKINAVKDRYMAYIQKEGLLPTLNLGKPGRSFPPEICWNLTEELLWSAERTEAWVNDNWREWIVACAKKAREDGHSPRDFWVYSLWNKVGSYQKWKALGYPKLDEACLRKIAW